MASQFCFDLRPQMSFAALRRDGSMNVRDAHGIAHSVESQLRNVLPGLEVTIHIEPIDEQESWEADELARLGPEQEQHAAARIEMLRGQIAGLSSKT